MCKYTIVGLAALLLTAAGTLRAEDFPFENPLTGKEATALSQRHRTRKVAPKLHGYKLAIRMARCLCNMTWPNRMRSQRDGPKMESS
jgi:hypothetical protein